MVDCSKLIRRRRLKVGLTTQKLAKMVGVSRSAVIFWENGTNIPTPINTVALLEVSLGYKVGELFEILTRDARKKAKRGCL